MTCIGSSVGETSSLNSRNSTLADQRGKRSAPVGSWVRISDNCVGSTWPVPRPPGNGRREPDGRSSDVKHGLRIAALDASNGRRAGKGRTAGTGGKAGVGARACKRGFLLGRLSSAGPGPSPTVAKGRRPKPFTEAEVQMRERPTLERSRPRVFGEAQVRKIVANPNCVGMLGAERLLGDRERPLVE